MSAGPLAASFVLEGIRRTRFPCVDYRDAAPGRVAHLTGTRWPVWMIAQLLEECGGDYEAAAKHARKPARLLEMAMDYAQAYPEEIAACLRLNARRAQTAVR